MVIADLSAHADNGAALLAEAESGMLNRRDLDDRTAEWDSYLAALLRACFEGEDVVGRFFATYQPGLVVPRSEEGLVRARIERLRVGISRLRALITQVPLYPGSEATAMPPAMLDLDKALNILDRLHLVAAELEIRREKRRTIRLTDEYDVQDLLRSLLRLDFDDVRPEAWTPNYAGGSTRIDFLASSPHRNRSQVRSFHYDGPQYG